MTKPHTRAEFGDFQTPDNLARNVCALLSELGVSPGSILEPTCGRGSFLVAAARTFGDAEKIVGVEIKPEYSRYAEDMLRRLDSDIPFEIFTADFFSFEWESLIARLPQPLLVIGNPPWVTNTELGALQSKNVPNKSNFQNHRGIDAITGKGNFDISEYMLLCAVEWLNNTAGTLAMLCKTAVARKILRQAWKQRFGIKSANVYLVDASTHFGAAVESCLLVIEFTPNAASSECVLHPGLSRPAASAFGLSGGRLVANMGDFNRWKHLDGGKRGTWRSGIKHDCSKVMRFSPEGSRYRNGLGELVDLENKYLYPMLRSSDLANRRSPEPRFYMLVPQRFIGEQTDKIRDDAPQTWKYLSQHATFLDQRSSSIYRKRPRFSVFGVGDYSFVPWKVAIAGLYKKLAFRLVGPFDGRPVVMDDTCYFYPCQSEREATVVFEMLNSSAAADFLSSLVFWDDKRPVTAELLNRLDLIQLAKELDRLDELPGRIKNADDAQQVLF